MKVIERATTPNGIEIQIEDWSANYNFMAYAGTVAAYPIAQESGRNQFEPKIGEKFRLAFDFKSTELAATCFEQLKTGNNDRIVNLTQCNIELTQLLNQSQEDAANGR